MEEGFGEIEEIDEEDVDAADELDEVKELPVGGSQLKKKLAEEKK